MSPCNPESLLRRVARAELTSALEDSGDSSAMRNPASRGVLRVRVSGEWLLTPQGTAPLLSEIAGLASEPAFGLLDGLMRRLTDGVRNGSITTSDGAVQTAAEWV